MKNNEFEIWETEKLMKYLDSLYTKIRVEDRKIIGKIVEAELELESRCDI